MHCPTSGSLVYTIAAIAIPLSSLPAIYLSHAMIPKLSATAIGGNPTCTVCTHTPPKPPLYLLTLMNEGSRVPCTLCLAYTTWLVFRFLTCILLSWLRFPSRMDPLLQNLHFFLPPFFISLFPPSFFLLAMDSLDRWSDR